MLQLSVRQSVLQKSLDFELFVATPLLVCVSICTAAMMIAGVQ